MDEAHVILADGWLPSKMPVVGINWVEMCISQNKFVNTANYEFRQSNNGPPPPQRSAQSPERMETPQKPPTLFGQSTEIPLSQESNQNPSDTPFSTQFSSQPSAPSPVVRHDPQITNRAHSPARVTAAPTVRAPTHVLHPSSSKEVAPSTSMATSAVHRPTVTDAPVAHTRTAFVANYRPPQQLIPPIIKKTAASPQKQNTPLTARTSSMLIEGSTSSEDDMDDLMDSPPMMDEDTEASQFASNLNSPSAPSRSHHHSGNGSNRNSISSLPSDSNERDMREPRPLNEASSDEEFSPRVSLDKRSKASEFGARKDNEDDNWRPRDSESSTDSSSSSEQHLEINGTLTRSKLRNAPLGAYDTSPVRAQQPKEISTGSNSRRGHSSSKSKNKKENRRGERDEGDKDDEWRPSRPRPRPKPSSSSSKKRPRPDSVSPNNSGDEDGGRRRKGSETDSSSDDANSSSDAEQPRKKVPKRSENDHSSGFARREHREGHKERSTRNAEEDREIRIYLCSTSSSELEVESKVVSELNLGREVIIVRNVLEASHVIVSDESIKATNSILRAIASGKWVLRYKWYALLTRDRKIPNETQFETKRWAGAKRSRIIHEARKDIQEHEENSGNPEQPRQDPKATENKPAANLLFDSISFNIQSLSDTERSLLIDVFAATGAVIDSKFNSIKILPDERWDFDVPHQTWHHDGKAAMPFTYITDSVLNGERLGAIEWHEKLHPA